MWVRWRRDKDHGVMILGNSIASAWDDMYYLEGACEVQRLALSLGFRFEIGDNLIVVYEWRCVSVRRGMRLPPRWTT
jgi:hypothetical protein